MKTKTTLKSYAAILLIAVPFLLIARTESSPTAHPSAISTDENMMFEEPIGFWWQRITYTPNFPDSEEIVSYTAQNWPNGVEIDPLTGIVDGIATPPIGDEDSGIYLGTVTANYTDGTSLSRNFIFSMVKPFFYDFTLINASTNLPIGSLSDGDVIDINTTGASLNIRADANFEGGFTIARDKAFDVTFTLNGKKFSKESFSPYALAGDISGDYLEWSFSPGEYTLKAEVNATALGGQIVATSEIRFSINQPNDNAPLITEIIGEFPVYRGEEVDLQIEATDPNGDTLSYSATGLPSGLSIDAVTGRITGCLSVDSDDRFSTTLTATDPDGLSGSTALNNYIRQPLIESYTLIDADTDMPVPGFDPLNRYDTNYIALSVVGKNLNIRANTSQGPVCGGAVHFELDGAPFGTENVYPYALAGDIEGDYLNWTPSAGTHIIAAKIISKTTGNNIGYSFDVSINVTLDTVNVAPEITLITGNIPEFWGEATHLQVEASDSNGDVLTYSATGLPPDLSIDPITGWITGCLSLDSGDGSSTGYSATITATDPDGLSGSKTLEFFILQPNIESFTLINADTNSPVLGFDPLDSSVNNIDLNVVAANLNIRANTNIGAVCGGAIKFELDGAPFGTENVFPYALAGDIGGDYLNWTPSAGMHTITAKIVSQTTGFSFYGNSSVSINVISGSSKTAENTIVLYPNPSKDYIQFNFKENPKGLYNYRIVAIGGQKSLLKGVATATSGKVDIHSLQQGLYIIELTTENGAHRKYLKLLKE